MIDMWLLFFIISTTINVCIHIVVDYLRKGELAKKKEDNITRVRQVTAPPPIPVTEGSLPGKKAYQKCAFPHPKMFIQIPNI